MLKLTPAQLDHLDQLEKLGYVAEVRNALVSDFPELASDGTLRLRLERAYQYATEIGFTYGPAITEFLYYEATAPSFYREPAINAWLTRPGSHAEQRFTDLIALTKSKLKDF